MRRLFNVTLATPLPFFWRIILLCGGANEELRRFVREKCGDAVLSSVIFTLTVTQILRQRSKFASGWQSLRKIYSFTPTVIRWRDWRLIPYRYALNSWVENLRGRALHITNSMPQHTHVCLNIRMCLRNFEKGLTSMPLQQHTIAMIPNCDSMVVLPKYIHSRQRYPTPELMFTQSRLSVESRSRPAPTASGHDRSRPVPTGTYSK